MNQEANKTVIEKAIKIVPAPPNPPLQFRNFYLVVPSVMPLCPIVRAGVTTVAQFVTPRLSHTSARTFRISDRRQNEPSVQD